MVKSLPILSWVFWLIGVYQIIERHNTTPDRGIFNFQEGEKLVNIKHILKCHAYQNIPLSFDEAYELGCYTLAGCNGDSLAQVQSIACLCALHNRATYLWKWSKGVNAIHNGGGLPENAAEQVAGISAAIFQQDIEKSEAGFLKPSVDWAIDNCGMGGDLIVTANVSTISAFIAAAAGIPVCKHGSPANADKGRHGSSDFIDMCGINRFPLVDVLCGAIETECFGYTEALDTRFKQVHKQTHEIAQLPHMNDIIGPITNPCHPDIMTRKVVGVNHLIPPVIVAEAYQIMNSRGVTNLRHGLFVRGFVDTNGYYGMDEVSICPGGTELVELVEGKIIHRRLYAKDFGCPEVGVKEISPPEGMTKGEFSMKILTGETVGPPKEMVLANSVLLFYLAGFSDDLRECRNLADAILSDGRALQKMLSVREKLPR